MRQILTWIESDIEPVYSDAGGGRKTDSKAAFNDFCAAHIAPYIQQISGEDQLFRSQLQEIATTLQQGDIHRLIYPAQNRPRHDFQHGFDAVFVAEAVLKHFKLQNSQSSKQRNVHDLSVNLKRLDNVLRDQVIESLAE